MKSKKQLFIFFFSLIMLSGITQYYIIFYEKLNSTKILFQNSQGLIFLLMWIPTLSSILAGGHKEIMKNIMIRPNRNIITGLICPLIIYGIFHLYSYFSNDSFIGFSQDKLNDLGSIGIGNLIFVIFYFLVTSAGEELGWRGFLYSKIRDNSSKNYCALVVGLIWGIWHIPLILMTPYSGIHGSLISIINFCLLTISVSFIMGELYERNTNLIYAIIFHATHNFVFYFLLLGIDKETVISIIYSEFGLLAPIGYALILFALIFNAKRERNV